MHFKMNTNFNLKISHGNQPDSFELVIVEDGKQNKCHVKNSGNHFSVTINDTCRIDVEDSFNLNDHLIKTTMGDDNKVTMQLLSKGANGEIAIQYMGTKVKKNQFR